MTAQAIEAFGRDRETGLDPEGTKARSPTAMRHESAKEIALRIRSGQGPTRPIVQRCLERAKDERWI